MVEHECMRGDHKSGELKKLYPTEGLRDRSNEDLLFYRILQYKTCKKTLIGNSQNLTLFRATVILVSSSLPRFYKRGRLAVRKQLAVGPWQKFRLG